MYPQLKFEDGFDGSVKVCDCSDAQKCDESCVNRSIFVECMAATCRHKDGCQNQRLQNAKFPRSSIKKAGNRGFGLYAIEDIMPDNCTANFALSSGCRSQTKRGIGPSSPSGKKVK